MPLLLVPNLHLLSKHCCLLHDPLCYQIVGVPSQMIMDGTKTQTKGKSGQACHDAGCPIIELKRGAPAANWAKQTIGELKSDTKSDMTNHVALSSSLVIISRYVHS